MPKRVERIAYVGREALYEPLLPDPTEDAVARERLERENVELHKRLQHFEQALKAAAKQRSDHLGELG